MNNERPISVMVVEDDVEFQSLLVEVISGSADLVLRDVFDSIESFCKAWSTHHGTEEWLPDVFLADVLAGADPKVDTPTVLSAIRSEGYNFAVVLISSLELAHLIKIFQRRNPRGWRALKKSSRLSGDEVIQALRDAVDEVGRQ